MKLNPAILIELQNAQILEDRVLLVRQLDRQLYTEVNRALECLGGKWNRKAKAHVFDTSPGDLIGDAIATGEVVDAKKEFQFFETPLELARRMVVCAQLEAHHNILEPSAGRGAILNAIHEACPKALVTCCELNPKFAQELRQNYPVPVVTGDFLDGHYQPQSFDRIIANPPFRAGQDVDHVLHMWSLLRPGGRIVSITAPGWKFRQDQKYAHFRGWVRSEAGAEVEELPPGTFKEAGTNIRTIMLTLNKPSTQK